MNKTKIYAIVAVVCILIAIIVVLYLIFGKKVKDNFVNVNDMGYPGTGKNYDLQGSGQALDYCRMVGPDASGNKFFACALNGDTTEYSTYDLTEYSSPPDTYSLREKPNFRYDNFSQYAKSVYNTINTPTTTAMAPTTTTAMAPTTTTAMATMAPTTTTTAMAPTTTTAMATMAPTTTTSTMPTMAPTTTTSTMPTMEPTTTTMEPTTTTMALTNTTSMPTMAPTTTTMALTNTTSMPTMAPTTTTMAPTTTTLTMPTMAPTTTTMASTTTTMPPTTTMKNTNTTSIKGNTSLSTATTTSTAKPTETNSSIPTISPSQTIALLNSGVNLDTLTSKGISMSSAFRGPATNIVQTDFTGTSNIYSPYLYYNKGTTEKFSGYTKDKYSNISSY